MSFLERMIALNGKKEAPNWSLMIGAVELHDHTLRDDDFDVDVTSAPGDFRKMILSMGYEGGQVKDLSLQRRITQ